jgi:hypothetical protein
MSYTITKTDGTTLTQLVDGNIDQVATDLTLIGKNASGYGQYFNDNFIWLLENFASTTQPNHPITGQLWFDTTENRLKVYDGSAFKVSGGTVVANSVPSSITAGDIWIDSSRQQLYFNDGTSTKLAGPIYTAQQGVSGFTTSEVVDSLGISHTILTLSVAQTPIGIFSKDSFIPASTIAGFSGSINTGFNVGTATGVKFHTPVTQADSLLAADGTSRTAANFLSTTDDSATTGTISIQNAIPLILGQGSSTEINATTSIFQIKSNTSNQNYGINLLSGTGLDRAFFINATTKRTGIYTELPTATLDVNGDTRIRGDLIVEGATTTINTTNLEINDKLIELGKTTNPTNTTAEGGGFLLAAGTDVDKTLVWQSAGAKWTSSENFDLASGKSYKINNFDVLSYTTLGASVVNILGNLTGLTVSGSTNINYLTLTDSTISYTSLSQTNGTISLAPKGLGTVDVSTARITSVGNPVDTYDGTNKGYVDYTVRIASLALSISVPIGYTDNQICLNYLTKVFPPSEHETQTKCRVVVNQGGADTVRLYTLSSGNWTGGSLL